VKPKPKKFIEQPTYPGGNKALDEFIRTNMIYPDEAFKNRIQGAVNVKFDLDIYGKVIEARVTHGIGYDCDEEALRLVKLLRFGKKKYKGLHVIYHRAITVHFHLPDNPIPPKQQDLVIRYEYTESRKKTPQNDNITYKIVPDR
jgi:TonB family protein